MHEYIEMKAANSIQNMNPISSKVLSISFFLNDLILIKNKVIAVVNRTIKGKYHNPIKVLHRIAKNKEKPVNNGCNVLCSCLYFGAQPTATKLTEDRNDKN